MNIPVKLVSFVLTSLFAALTVGLIVVGGVYMYVAPQLPPTTSLQDVRLQEPLRIYASDGELIAQYGTARRIPVALSEVPESMVQAFLAAEDDRFFEHPGVDYQGLLRASWALLKTGEKAQGGSTITMQVARNFFLSSEKTYIRKLREILLALQIERELSKEDILELYLNKIYLGNRSYGVAAAAQFYYGTALDELSLAQMAMIAGLPKAPSSDNPIVNPEDALERRNYILGRMYRLDLINDERYRSALAEPVTAKRHLPVIEASAPYVAEMVRKEMVERYGEEEAYTGAYEVFTTVDARLQAAAMQVLRSALIEYDIRHGYRGPEGHADLAADSGPADWEQALTDFTVLGDLLPALVIKLEGQTASAYHPDQGVIEIPWTGLSWARSYIDEDRLGASPKTAADILKPGDIIRLQRSPEEQWRLVQIPKVQGALVSMVPDSGAITALVGGFDFDQSSFNRVTQALRQPGSSFKPFIYSAALAQGFTPATVINDAPVVLANAKQGQLWRPENYGREFKGPTRLREALTHSRNLVSIRVLRAIGINYAIDYATRFGFERERLPNGLSLALGTSVNTPLEMVSGFAVFANGGYQVRPFVIERIVGPNGENLLENESPEACCDEQSSSDERLVSLESQLQADIQAELGQGKGMAGKESLPVSEGEPAISPENAYLITSMMRDVIRSGTGRRALELGRNDLAGKTGTTNSQRDAWFSGYNADIVATAWVGFDEHEPLGKLETGGRAALPMWMEFMRAALEGVPEEPLAQPPGIVTKDINPDTGLLASNGSSRSVAEVFSADHLPSEDQQPLYDSRSGIVSNPEQLF